VRNKKRRLINTKSRDIFNINKNVFISVTNMSNMSNPLGSFPTSKLSAGRELQAWGYKFAVSNWLPDPRTD
jgi:hypothetical protein